MRIKEKVEPTKTRQELKVEKQAIKEHKKEIERLNKMLIPVNKNTNTSLKLVSFDPSGALRKENNQWSKVYRIVGLTSDNKAEFIQMLTNSISLRCRVTTRFIDGNRTDFLSLFYEAEVYETVKNAFESEENIINSLISSVKIESLEINDYMKEIQSFYLNKEPSFNYASSVRGKADWKKLVFQDTKEYDGYFEFEDNKGLIFSAIQYPSAIKENILSDLLEFECPITFSLDIQPLSDEQMSDFNRTLERRFNKKVEADMRKFVNLGFSIVLLTDSISAKDIVKTTLTKALSNVDVIVAPTYGENIKKLESIYSLGLTDYRSMRNINTDEIKNLFI